jgi:ABC-2 type transport system ATP-binding protein/lipopolysaccharide transport system ATP-binding protein
LREIDLELRPGDRLALVGHNGAGKSTLLRVLAGAYEPSRGVAEIQGKVSSLLDMTMGMDPELTGRENIVLRGIFLGMTFREISDLAPSIEEFSELGGFVDLPMRTYSSGMTLRLAFAVSTAVQPDILLLDEMISVGDADFANKARTRIEQVMENSRIFVLASHDPKMLQRDCNKGILLSEGQIVAAGSLDDVLMQHA